MGNKEPDLPEQPSILVSHPHLNDLITFLPELNKESDRGMALIATSFIDELLHRTIEAFLIKGHWAKALLEGFNAPLGSFSTRITAAAALGLISELEAKEANLLRKIRNMFAHEVHVSFRDQKVEALCGNLELSAKDYGDVIVGARGQFSTAAVALIINLTNRPHYVGLQRLPCRDWKV